MATDNGKNKQNDGMSDRFSEDNLRKIPFISNERVTAIVDHIAMHGEPKTVDDFQKIPNIGAGLAQQLYEHFYGEMGDNNAGNRNSDR